MNNITTIIDKFDISTYIDITNEKNSDGEEIYVILREDYTRIMEMLEKEMTTALIDKREEIRTVKGKEITVYLLMYQKGREAPYEEMVNTYDYYTTIVGTTKK